MAYQCRIKPKHAIGRLQYKGKTFTKQWQESVIDVSTTNKMLECFEVKEQKVTNTVVEKKEEYDGFPEQGLEEQVEQQSVLREMTKKQLLKKAKEAGIDTVSAGMNKLDIIEEIELAELGGIQ